ncbi:hypothetical protein IW140_004539 [Coemansia sp. RSA 1813]|nr:hypothetical protein EV178_004603 [Coemansia sp. RSA 1646]KAJ2567326.1 hypothetical protein IW140_004539 [Coemansia sp. RSA 1813]
MDKPVYELSTGKIIQYPSFEYQMLIYHEFNFQFVTQDMYPPSFRDTPLMAQLIKMDSVESINDIVQDYVQNRKELNYSSFVVLHDNICVVYVLGQRFMDHHGIEPIEEGNTIYMDFWIARYR